MNEPNQDLLNTVKYSVLGFVTGIALGLILMRICIAAGVLK